MLRTSISFNSLLLGAFALVTAGVVAITYQSTVEKINESKRRAAQAALFEIIPQDQIDNDLFSDTLTVPEEYREFLGLLKPEDVDKKIHIARKNNQPFAAIIPTVAPDGYSGAIKMIIGINNEGEIAGLRITDHKETPGLGDYVDVRKSNWVLSFNGKTLGSRFDEKTSVKRTEKNVSASKTNEAEKPEEKFDQLTGATITRTAVIRQVKKALSFYQIAQPLDLAVNTNNGLNSTDSVQQGNTHE